MSDKKKWISEALKTSSRGKLHKELGVAPDKKIPERKIEKAAHSKNIVLKKEAILAETLKGMPRRSKK